MGSIKLKVRKITFCRKEGETVYLSLIHIFQRLKTLATQGANGTYDDTARGNINKEITDLNAEIDRIAESTSFNGVTPLKQNTKFTFQIGATKDEVLKFDCLLYTSTARSG